MSVIPAFDIAELAEKLVSQLRQHASCAVAFSGGVDSAVVAKAAHLAVGDRAVAVTGVSPSLAPRERDEARSLARHIGIRHVEIATDEFSNPDYLKNAPDRCYHCKTELYTQLDGWAEKLAVEVVYNGANADDAGDYRPGMRAAAEHQVRSPLLENGLDKATVRALAAHWQLPIWDKPASPCLSSRIAYGQAVTPERLAMINGAEEFLRRQGLNTLRVRYHEGDLARIEVPAEALPLLAIPPLRDAVVQHLRELGFKFVTIDLQGFRSGSLNDLVPLQVDRP